MKSILALLLVSACGVAAGQEAPSVMLQVKRISSATEVRQNWRNRWGASDKDFSRTIGIDITLRNMRSAAAQVSLDILFVAKLSAGTNLWVFDRQIEDLALDSAKPYTAVKLSKPLESNVRNFAWQGFKDERGGRVEGYIVRVLVATNIVKVSASSHALEQLGGDEEALSALIQASREIEARDERPPNRPMRPPPQRWRVQP